jgi:hypothetical protein
MSFAAMRRIGIAFLLAASLLLGGAAQAADDEPRQAFVGGLEDLPLMEGLAEDRAAALVFDKPDGRLVDAYAFGPVEPEAVAAFYRETLPQLGWRAIGPLVFEREGEELSIATEAGEGGVLVRFHLTPR